jgi:hypothetical protein
MKKQSLSNKLVCAIAIIAALSSANTRAEKITLDFEGIGDTAIGNFYNGGTDDSGKSGINYGIYFSNDALGLIDTDESSSADFSGLFANEPSGSSALIFQGDSTATMNVAAGFDSAFALSYSSSADAIIRIFDGLDGTGTELTSLNLATNYTNNNCIGDPSGNYCHWDKLHVTFKGKAMSVVFEGPQTSTFYDDITLGSQAPDRDLMSECKKDLKWHRRNSRTRSNVNNRHSLAFASLHNECKIFRWYRRGRR